LIRDEIARFLELTADVVAERVRALQAFVRQDGEANDPLEIAVVELIEREDEGATASERLVGEDLTVVARVDEAIQEDGDAVPARRAADDGLTIDDVEAAEVDGGGSRDVDGDCDFTIPVHEGVGVVEHGDVLVQETKRNVKGLAVDDDGDLLVAGTEERKAEGDTALLQQANRGRVERVVVVVPLQVFLIRLLRLRTRLRVHFFFFFFF
jgi:hypothetical protein